MTERNPEATARWKIAAAAVAVHLSIGSVYAWSVFVKPLGTLHGWSRPAVTGTFSVAIVMLGLSAAFGGSWMERVGPRRSVLLSAGCFGLGLAGAGLASHIGSLPLLYASYGGIGGIGLGLGYVPPVSALLKWFPDRRGLATGIAVCGFGAGALVAGPVATWLIVALGVPMTFWTFAGAYFAVILIASQVLQVPRADWRPKGWKPTAAVARARAARDHALGEALRTPQFWLLWGLFFINISAGIMLISLASPMAQELVGMTAAQAGLMVGMMGIFNGAGRIAWSATSDVIGRTTTFGSMFVLQIALFAMLSRTTNAFAFQAMFFLILTCYGGGFATCPAFIADLFGTAHVGAIYGVALTAWSAAGFLGPTLGAFMRERMGSYAPALYGACGMLVLALGFTAIISVRLGRMASPASAETTLAES